MADKSQTEVKNKEDDSQSNAGKPARRDDDSPHYTMASPALLAMQPSDVDVKEVSTKKQKRWSVLRGHLETRLTGLRMWRNSWWNTNWATLAQYLLPRRSIWQTQSAGGQPTPNNMNRGRMLNDAIKDPTGTYAVRVCSAGLMSGLASPSRPWFKIVTKIKNFEPDADGRKWMDEVEDRIYTILAGSNFYNAFAQECEDLVVYGTAPTIIYEDAREFIRVYNPANGEYFLGSDATMRIDTLARQFVMTVSQIVDFFGVKNCPEPIQKLWEAKGNSLDQEWTVAHMIEPNFDIEGAGKLDGRFDYREVYWLWGQGSSIPLSECGFVDAPFTAARWGTQSNDAYGRSPGMDVLPDVIQLQVMTSRLSEAIEKQVRPPLLADITMKNQPSSSLPGHVTYVNNLGPGTGMRSIYEVNPDIAGLSGLIQQIEKRIQTGLFNDLFAMFAEIPTGKMTAYETAQRAQERLQIIGPVIENLLNESLKPKLKIIYSLMSRKGMFPPAPQSMRGIPLDLQFVSILALAQKAAATGGIERLTAFIGNLVAVNPQALDNLDVDSTIEEMNELLGNPNKILRGAPDVAKIRQNRAQQQAAQAKAQAIQQTANTVNTGAQAAATLSQTQVGEGGNALSMLLGK